MMPSSEAAQPRISVVIPVRDGEATIGAVLGALDADTPKPDEVIVVDDGSTDRSAEIAFSHGASVLRPDRHVSAGGARNLGWEAATGDAVVFLDADAVPGHGFVAGVVRALEEFPGAIVEGGRTLTGTTAWGWVASLQIETPYLARGEPRRVNSVSSYALVVPRELGIQFDESYGAEDALFSVDALAAGVSLIFDPRFHAEHRHGRTTLADLRSQQRRLAYGLARLGPIQREGFHKRLFSRLPLHYFTFVRLVAAYRRLRDDPALRRRFVRLLPHLAAAEWLLGFSALRYVLRRPPLRSEARTAA